MDSAFIWLGFTCTLQINMYDTMNATRKRRGAKAPKVAMRTGSSSSDEDADFLQQMRIARPLGGHTIPPTFLEMRAAQVALMMAPPSRDAKYYGLPDNAVANAVAKHLLNKQCFDARIEWPPCLFPVEVRTSPVHGKGVFVTKDVECGQILSLYPPDAFVFSRPGGKCQCLQVSPDIGCDREEAAAARRLYTVTLGTYGRVEVGLVGMPRLCNDPAYVAHLANDPVGDARSKKDYYARIANRGNAYLTGFQNSLCQALFAGKRIRAGEEVLVPYDWDYWEELLHAP